MIFNVNSFSKKCSGISKSSLIRNGKFKESSSLNHDLFVKLLNRKKQLSLSKLTILSKIREGAGKDRLNRELLNVNEELKEVAVRLNECGKSLNQTSITQGKVKRESKEDNVSKDKVDEEKVKGLTNLSLVLMILPLPWFTIVTWMMFKPFELTVLEQFEVAGSYDWLTIFMDLMY